MDSPFAIQLIGKRLLLFVATLAVAGALGGCGLGRRAEGPSVEFTRIPQADEGGREKQDIIEGRVQGARADQQIVLYAKSGVWWVQPLANQPFTRIQENSKWSNATHLGLEYAALLVNPGYRPPATMAALPPLGEGIAAMAVTPGASTPPSRTIPFSGYEWRVRNAPSNRGGPNLYATDNAWTDAGGALHLRISKTAGEWTCAEVSLTRSLGYGTYSAQVRDLSNVEPAAVFSMFTYDYALMDQNHGEMGIEMSRWGDPPGKNGQFVVQPYYVPANVAKFAAPSGPLVYSIHWEEGRVSFQVSAASKTGTGPLVAEHVFTSGIPLHLVESMRMNLYIFRKAKVPLKNGAEVVIDRFEYLP